MQDGIAYGQIRYGDNVIATVEPDPKGVLVIPTGNADPFEMNLSDWDQLLKEPQISFVEEVTLQ